MALALLLPQTRQTQHCSQLQGLCLLLTSNVDGFVKTFLRLCSVFPTAYSLKPRAFLRQQEFTFQPIQLYLPPTFPSFIDHSGSVGQRGEPLFGLSGFSICLG